LKILRSCGDWITERYGIRNWAGRTGRAEEVKRRMKKRLEQRGAEEGSTEYTEKRTQEHSQEWLCHCAESHKYEN
jgi:hypothetical protein